MDKNLQNNEYYAFLIDAIPNLKFARSYSGGEGRAYFLDDNLIVKEYLKADDWDGFDKTFDAYCLQMKTFADKGFSVPKIYAWARIPNMNHYLKGEKNKHRYFILEEYVKGRELYFGYLADAYEVAKDLCSRNEFNESIKNGEDSLFTEIIKRYFEDYITMNECIESMSESELAKFLTDSYNMYFGGRVLYPDLFPHNILVDGDSVKMIDPHINTDSRERDFRYIESDYVTDVVNLFLYNTFVNKPRKSLSGYKHFNFSQFQNLIDKNKRVSKEALVRVLTLMNSYCNNPKLLTDRNGGLLFSSLGMTFDKRDVGQIIDVINFER